MPAHEIERAVEMRERAEPEQVDLEEPERLDVVFVPLDHRARFHRRVLDGHERRDRLVAEQETAGMDREVPREIVEFVRELDELQRGR